MRSQNRCSAPRGRYHTMPPVCQRIALRVTAALHAPARLQPGETLPGFSYLRLMCRAGCARGSHRDARRQGAEPAATLGRSIARENCLHGQLAVSAPSLLMSVINCVLGASAAEHQQGRAHHSGHHPPAQHRRAFTHSCLLCLVWPKAGLRLGPQLLSQPIVLHPLRLCAWKANHICQQRRLDFSAAEIFEAFDSMVLLQAGGRVSPSDSSHNQLTSESVCFEVSVPIHRCDVGPWSSLPAHALWI